MAASVENSLSHSPNDACRSSSSVHRFSAEDSHFQLFDVLNDAEWSNILGSCSNQSFFYGSAWARVLQGSYGYQPLYFVSRQSTPFVLPWMEVNSWLTGKRGVALPFTDACTVDGIPPGAFRQALEEITRLGVERRWKYWEFRGGSELLSEITPSTQFLNHQLKLNQGEDMVFSGLYSTTRTAIRKAEAGGVTVEVTRELEATTAFYQLLCQTRKRHGTPPQPFSFFELLHREVLQKGHGFIALARKNEQPIAGIFFLRHGSSAIYKYAASDDRLQQYRASNLVLWRGIQYCLQQGISLLDFGRTSLRNTGLQRFKLGWGAEERRLGYLRYDNRARSYITVNDKSSGWHSPVFRHIPNTVGQLIGRFLYRHLA